MQVFPTFALYNDRNENIVKHYTEQTNSSWPNNFAVAMPQR